MTIAPVPQRILVIVLIFQSSRSCDHRAGAEAQVTRADEERLEANVPNYGNTIGAFVLGSISVTFRLYFGHISAILQSHIGYISATFRLYFGHISAIFRLCFGYVSDTFRFAQDQEPSSISSNSVEKKKEEPRGQKKRPRHLDVWRELKTTCRGEGFVSPTF